MPGTRVKMQLLLHSYSYSMSVVCYYSLSYKVYMCKLLSSDAHQTNEKSTLQSEGWGKKILQSGTYYLLNWNTSKQL